jgi:hypothetical protein
MNLRYWNRQHTFGLIVAVFSVLIFTPIVMYIFTWIDHSNILGFDDYLDKFLYNKQYRGKMISLAVVPNLIWFYWSMNKRNYNFTTGIILGSAVYVPYIIYNNFLQ